MEMNRILDVQNRKGMVKKIEKLYAVEISLYVHSHHDCFNGYGKILIEGFTHNVIQLSGR